MTSSWQLVNPISAIIFDCDGTLSNIEGIDEVAKHNNVGGIVEHLTREAMGNTGMSKDLYAKRLNWVKPTLAQINALGKEYIKHQTLDVVKVINVFQRLQKQVYIVSAGFLTSVRILGNALHIPNENIFAVNLFFDDQNKYCGFDESSPLVNKYGKREIVELIKHNHANVGYVGDGLNDYEVYDLVTRFVGYGGSFYRQNIADLCQFYIKARSLAPLLPLFLTAAEVKQLSPEENILYQKGTTLFV